MPDPILVHGPDNALLFEPAQTVCPPLRTAKLYDVWETKVVRTWATSPAVLGWTMQYGLSLAHTDQ